MIIADTYAWIEYFRGSAEGTLVKKRLQAGNAFVTPSIVLAELARHYHRAHEPEELIRNRLAFVESRSAVAEIDAGLALAATKAFAQLEATARQQRLAPPGLADALVLATARHHKAQILTGDRHFARLAETLFLPELA